MAAFEALTGHLVTGRRFRNGTTLSTVALALLLPACDGMTVTAPDTVPLQAAGSALSTDAIDESASGVIVTTYIATLVGIIPVSQTVRPNGDITQTVTTLVWESNGDWEGTWVGDVRSTINANGVTTDQASFTFEGTILGYAGGLNLRFNDIFRADGAFKGKASIVSGTGDLANLHGHVTVEIVGPGVIEGTARVQFAP